MQAQYTSIPDSEFEWHLILTGIDSEGTHDGQVLTSDIETVTHLYLSWYPLLTDLTGIEDFASLEVMYLTEVGITEIDLSQNLNLQRLHLDNVALNSLDISNNVNLVAVYVYVNCSGCFESSLSELDFSNNLLLEEVGIGGTLMEYIDLSNNPNLDHVSLGGLSNEYLKYVNLKNGNNINCNWVQITAPNVICTQVDDPDAVMEGDEPPYDDWDIQNGMISDNCPGIDTDELDLVNNVNVYPNPTMDELHIEVLDESSFKRIHLYNTQGQRVYSGDFATQLDLSRFPAGVYWLSIKGKDGNKVVKKVVKL